MDCRVNPECCNRFFGPIVSMLCTFLHVSSFAMAPARALPASDVTGPSASPLILHVHVDVPLSVPVHCLANPRVDPGVGNHFTGRDRAVLRFSPAVLAAGRLVGGGLRRVHHLVVHARRPSDRSSAGCPRARHPPPSRSARRTSALMFALSGQRDDSSVTVTSICWSFNVGCA